MAQLPVDPSFSSPLPDAFGLSAVGLFASPALVDIDRDGDLDLFIGNNVGNTLFFRNTAPAGASDPGYAAAITNPFGISSVGFSATPTFVDIDGDGDLDLFVGDFYGNTRFFRNQATSGSSTPVFATGQLNPFFITDSGDNSAPAFADLDGDGDLDLYIGTRSGNIRFLRNIGSATNPSFTAGPSNPFGISNVGSDAKPKFVDLDHDGDLDLFVSNSAGTTFFFRNTGSTTAPAFAVPVSNPFGIENVGGFAVPSLGDADGDGDVDLFLGVVEGGTTFFFRNTAPTASTTPSTPPPPQTVTPQTFNGTTGDDVLGSSQSVDLIKGFSGNDTLEGKGGNDTLEGGSGDDIYSFDADDQLGTDSLIEPVGSDGGIDTLSFTQTSSQAIKLDLSLATVQQINSNLSLSLDAVDRYENVFGGALNDDLHGNILSNLLDGRAGTDTLTGGDGSDTYLIETVGDLVVETNANVVTGGTDTVVSSLTAYILTPNVENLTLAAGALNGTGNGLNNLLTGNGVANSLNGGAGVDTLDGGAGIDTLSGGDGRDIYFIETIGDLVVESNATIATGGNDTVISSLTTYTLTDNVENLTLSGAALNGNGNGLNNLLNGNAAANSLNGANGNDFLNGGAGADNLNGGADIDTLNGGAGIDTLTGGLGVDTFRFDSVLNATTNRDVITDFSVAEGDGIQLENSVFTALTTTGTLAATAFVVGATATSASHRILYNSATGLLSFDRDGNGAAGAIAFARLSSGLALTNTSFTVT
jgi:Ca2+-binding RTX toxin-like protein